MIYTGEELKKVEERLESDRACGFIDRLNDIIGDDDLPSVDDLIDAGIKSFKRQRLFISKVVVKSGNENKDYGYCLEIEDSNGDMGIFSIYRVDDGKVSSNVFDKLNELAFLGYDLRFSNEIKYLGKEVE